MSGEAAAADPTSLAGDPLTLRVADALLAGCIERPLAALLPVELLARLGRDLTLALLRDPQADTRLVRLYQQAQTCGRCLGCALRCRPTWSCWPKSFCGCPMCRIARSWLRCCRVHRFVA
jgi:hypothetical protein